MQLVARANMKLGDKIVKAGETFELEDRYARTLIATRQATVAPAKPDKKPAAKKAEKAEEKPVEAPKRTYKTRQMKADS